MIDLSENLSIAQVAFFLGVIAFVVVWKFFIKLPPNSTEE